MLETPAQRRTVNRHRHVGSGSAGPIPFPRHVPTQEIEFPKTPSSGVERGLPDQELARSEAGERRIETRFEQVIRALVLEREVKRDAAPAGAQKCQRELPAPAEGPRDRRVKTAQRGLAGDGGAGI